MSPRSARVSGAEVAPLFAALGDETRLALLSRLGTARALSIAQLTSGTPITRQAVTKHLHVLAGAGLVRDARHGRERLWQLDARRLEIATRYLQVVSRRWDAALDRLKTFVEE
jgi:DNA-binding transcriptional ArsR family regulator